MQTCYLGWLMTSYRLVGRSFTLSNLILTDVVRELICHGKSVFLTMLNVVATIYL
jgi:hypothetical protein